MATIAIEGMEFHAFHGCFKEEQIIGNTFIVDVIIEADTSFSEETDDLNETVNYADIFDLVKQEMQIKSKLLEHVARRIIDAVLAKFEEIEFIEVKVSKLNPPVGGKVHSVSVTLDNIEE